MRLPEAVALGAVHGPAELLPISSSGHTELIPWLARWEYAELDGELRKAFEIALHAGTAAALLVALREEVVDAAQSLDRRRLQLLAGSFVVPAIVGLLLERPIERRLGGPRSIAAGLLAGSLALALADRADERRGRDEATLCDALALGAAQACALAPGVSRNGATLAAARARGFSRRDASVLSRHIALPVIAGATMLKTVRLLRRGLPREERAAFAAGTAAAFVSTLASVRLLRPQAGPPTVEGRGTAALARDGGPLWPFAAYRVALAGAVLWEHARR